MAAMTLTEKIIAQHSAKGKVAPGDIVFATVDLMMGTDATAPLSAKVFAEMGGQKVCDRFRIALINDHFIPARDIEAAERSRSMKEFAFQQRIVNYFEVGRSGICHVIVPEQGLVVPGDLVIGADSHTCTYGALGAFATGVGSTDTAAAWALGEIWLKVPSSIKIVFSGTPGRWVCGKDLILYALAILGPDGALYKAIEFCGETLGLLSMADRFTICNMAVEAGAKNGIIAPDQETDRYLKGRTSRVFHPMEPDPDASYERVIEIDASSLEPQVAMPHLPSNSKPISSIGGIPIEQVFIGSCTNGRIEDLRIAADLMRGKSVAPGLRAIIIPGSQETYRNAAQEGLLETFIEAGAAVSYPTCGPCLGGHMGVLAEGEKCLSTTSRNFVGRMGHPKSEVYLASPAVAAATAIKGRIAHPDEIG